MGKWKTPGSHWICRRNLMLARRKLLTGKEIVGADFALCRMMDKCAICCYRGSDECTGVAKYVLTEVRKV